MSQVSFDGNYESKHYHEWIGQDVYYKDYALKLHVNIK